MDIIMAVICTLVAGYLGSGILGNLLNWPDAGAICAIATMGAFILNECTSKKSKSNDQNDKRSSFDDQDEDK